MLTKDQNPYILLRSHRKTLAIEIKADLSILVRVPQGISKQRVDYFVEKNREWIKTHLEKQKLRNEAQPVLNEEQIKELRMQAKTIIPLKVAQYADVMGLHPTGVKITSAAKRYGSCSSKDSLCFSWRLMLLEDEGIDYVVIHELAHIRHKNHGRDFYALIEQYLPDYRKRIKALKNG